jgi:peptidoglycan hydrolase-like protein with peptidoglycan-binding domain
MKHSKHKPSTHSTSGKHSRGKSRGKRKRGQQAIDSPRARQIQEALIRQHYMEGEPSGKWDTATQDAMKRYQAAQGWQSKTAPDSRALIKLGLGPSTDGLLNPESAMPPGPLASDGKAGTKQATVDPVNPASNTASDNKPQR